MIKSNTVNVSFTCEAEGATSYHWEKQNGDISSYATGMNTTTLTINNIQSHDAGNYRCVASNASGSSYSEYATLSANGIIKCILLLDVVINSAESSKCAMETDNVYGFNWPSTEAGHMAIVNCSVYINITVATRLCNINGVWDNIDVSNCESDEYSFLSIWVNDV